MGRGTNGEEIAADTLAAFRGRLSADPVLADRLAAITDCDAFVSAACDLATSDGRPLNPDSLRRALRPDPLGIGRFDDLGEPVDAWPDRGWLPTAVVPAADGWVIDWAHFGGATLTEPFFEDSIRRACRRPINRVLRRRTALAQALTPALGMRPPDGLIFHMSRCGSTLVARMLAALSDTIVLSEPPPLDTVMQIARSWTGGALDDRAALLRGIVAALGNGRSDDDRYFLKVDSWHALALPLFRRAFPDTPWLFLHRDPVEVLVSQMQRRGIQSLPGGMGDLFGIADAHLIPAEEYTALVLAKINAALLDAHGLGGGLVVDYADLPAAMSERILPHFRIRPTPQEREKMATAMTRNAKAPYEAFVSDRADKQAAASDAIRAAADRHLGDLHRRLCALAPTPLLAGETR